MYNDNAQEFQCRMAASRHVRDTLTVEGFAQFSNKRVTGRFRKGKYRAVNLPDDASPSGSSIHWEILDKGDFISKEAAEHFLVNMYNVAHPTSNNPLDWYYSSYRRSKFIRLVNPEFIL